MKLHFTVIPGLRDVYLNWDVLLKITSYRGSYDIGAIGTSPNRIFEYHGPHWLRQSKKLCFNSWISIFDLTKNGYLVRKFSKLSSECLKNDWRPGEKIFLILFITINGSYVASRTVREHSDYIRHAWTKIVCLKWPLCNLILNHENLVKRLWPLKNFLFHIGCKLLGVWLRVGSDRNHGYQGF